MYSSSKRAWMTSSLFSNWLSQCNQIFQKMNRKIVLLINNAPSHTIIGSYSNIDLYFLPKNTTGLLQPMDRGIIRNFKLKFTKLKMSKIVQDIENGGNVYESYKKINLKDTIVFTDMAWEGVTSSTIYNCFKHLLNSNSVGNHGNVAESVESRN